MGEQSTSSAANLSQHDWASRTATLLRIDKSRWENPLRFVGDTEMCRRTGLETSTSKLAVHDRDFGPQHRPEALSAGVVGEYVVTQQDHEHLDEECLEEGLAELQRIAESSSVHSPYFDNIHGYQSLAEIAKVRDWANHMTTRGDAVCKIRPNRDAAGNPNDPPDVLADMNGRLVGIEVTDLMEYVSTNMIRILGCGSETILRWKPRRGKPVFAWSGSALDKEERDNLENEVREKPYDYQGTCVVWTLDRFQNGLRAIVSKKDRQASSKKHKRAQIQGEQALELRLHKRILLIFTPEPDLQDNLAEYVANTRLPLPENFDQVFVMGDYLPDGGSGRHPVFEVYLSA